MLNYLLCFSWKVHIKTFWLHLCFHISVQVKQLKRRNHWNHLLYKSARTNEKVQPHCHHSQGNAEHSNYIISDRVPWLHHLKLTEWKVTCGQTEQTHKAAVKIQLMTDEAEGIHIHAHTSQPNHIKLRGSESLKVFSLLSVPKIIWLSGA